LATHGLFDQGSVGRILDEHDRCAADHSFQLYSLLIFQMWHDRFLAP
jgi:hypothetical protein